MELNRAVPQPAALRFRHQLAQFMWKMKSHAARQALCCPSMRQAVFLSMHAMCSSYEERRLLRVS